MSKLKKYNLGLFLTEKNGLQTWDKTGILSREIAPYNILANYFNKIFIFSYGDEADLEYQNYFVSNIKIVPKNTRMRLKGYYWLLPFIHWKKIRQCRFLKTNQFKSRAALIAKIINPWAKLFLRSGYLPSLFEKQQTGKAGLFLRWWEKIAFQMCTLGVVASEADKNYLLRSYKIKPEKIKVIPNYIDTNLFGPDSQKKYDDCVIYVGRLHEQKNLYSLVKALADTQIRLDIVSSQRSGEAAIKNQLAETANQNKVKIKFLGRIDNEKLPQVLNQYKVFVLPSLYEGTPKALLEAMSCGLACLATDVAGNREIVENNKTGILTNTDPESLRVGILKLVNNQSLQRELGKSAREFVVSNFSLASQIKKEVKIYENFI